MKALFKKKGFTLVETIIYVIFFGLLSVLAVQSMIIMMNSFYKLRLSQSVNQSATTGLERMSREIRSAYDIDATQSVFMSSPGRLTLKTKDSAGANTTVEFYVNNSDLRFREGGVDKGSLLTKRATITNLVFYQLANPETKAIKIEMSLRDDRGTLIENANFYDTIILRGSAH